MPLIKGLFFDLDGTLVNTYEADYLAYRDAIAEITGVQIKQEDFYRTNGMVMRNKLAILTPKLNESDYPKVAAGKKRHYPKYLDHTKVNKSLIHLLLSQSQHMITALITTASKDNAELVLKHHKLKSYFEFCVYGSEVKTHKPNPESYLLALDRAGLKADEVIAFEDSKSGVTAATRAGISVIPIKSS